MSEELTIFSAVYTGRRLDQKGKVYYVWMFDGETEARWYSKLRGSVIGGLYSVESNESRQVFPASLKYVDTSDTSATVVEEWVVADLAANQRVQAARAESSAKKSQDPIADACEDLRRIYGAARTWQNKRAILDLIVNEVTR